ncbi:Carbohydrate ABC transporter substrate-binding protein, CUT1 family [metagenome]|uniref:Carbohydrate ABC transporter substrate-binding protein, CUT1 family n=1 Tax=metagenome TaxID=256318 RepID=A0A2P2BZC5_9ZZZZ
MRSRRAGALVAATALVLLAGCTTDKAPPVDKPTPTTPTTLSFSTYGPPAEVAVYRRLVEAWNIDHPDEQVTLRTAADRADQASLVAAGGSVPDVFLLDRLDLAQVIADDVSQPVGDLLDEPDRDVDFGDGYPIDAVGAFANDNDLECLPYGFSPMVMYVNTSLIDFTRMARRGLDVPTQPGRWSFEQFAEGARFASRPATRAAGVQIEPTVEGLAPFIYSGGGDVFDDDTTPTSLAFSEGDSQAALATTLELLRNPPSVTLSDQQLAHKSALDWFKAGKLGMIAGYRSLVPELRATGVTFDVMQMPSLGDEQTVADITGLCMSKDAPSADAAADFIYYLASSESVASVAAAGYLVPANLEVATSDAFLQPGRQPLTATVFNDAARNIVIPPMLSVYPELEESVANDIQRLFSMGVLNLPLVTSQIDTDSQAVLSPPEPSESASPSASPSG